MHQSVETLERPLDLGNLPNYWAFYSLDEAAFVPCYSESEQPLPQLSRRAESTILVGDCREAMSEMEAESVDAIVCDPPYGLKFMGKRWDDPGSFVERRPDRSVKFDRFGGNHNPCNPQDQARTARVENQRQQEWHYTWAVEALRVLKPGGHLLAFGGTRTYHRMVCAIEDAGFEIRDSLHWIYGSGFPKSLDVSKQIDKMAGAEREVVGEYQWPADSPSWSRGKRVSEQGDGIKTVGQHFDGSQADVGKGAITAPATEEAQHWQGWGTALKPAHEPIVMARKPLSEKNVAQNVLRWNTGCINVDGCRVGHNEPPGKPSEGMHGRSGGILGTTVERHRETTAASTSGRWPPNLLLSHHELCRPTGEIRRVKGTAPRGEPSRGQPKAKTLIPYGGVNNNVHHADPDGYEGVEEYLCVEGCAILEMDSQSGQLKSGDIKPYKQKNRDNFLASEVHTNSFKGDTGGASRYFPRFPSSLEPEAPFKYAAKASRRERNAGLEGMPPKDVPGIEALNRPQFTDLRMDRPQQRIPKANNHPTVKSLAVMDWLVKLVCPPNGTVLDPFMGSGSTGCSAVRLGFNFIGIEQSEEYAEIARRRIAHWSNIPDSLEKPEPRLAPSQTPKTLF